MTPLITKTVAKANHLICWRSIDPACRSRASIEDAPTTTSAYMNASISLEAFGGPWFQGGLLRVQGGLERGVNAPRRAAGRGRMAANKRTHAQRVRGSLRW